MFKIKVFMADVKASRHLLRYCSRQWYKWKEFASWVGEIWEIISNEKQVTKFNNYFRPVETVFERFYEGKLKYSLYLCDFWKTEIA